MNCRWKTDDH